MGAASETAATLIESLQKGKSESGGGGSDDFFKTAAENFLAAIIYFLFVIRMVSIRICLMSWLF